MLWEAVKQVHSLVLYMTLQPKNTTAFHYCLTKTYHHPQSAIHHDSRATRNVHAYMLFRQELKSSLVLGVCCPAMSRRIVQCTLKKVMPSNKQVESA